MGRSNDLLVANEELAVADETIARLKGIRQLQGERLAELEKGLHTSPEDCPTWHDCCHCTPESCVAAYEEIGRLEASLAIVQEARDNCDMIRLSMFDQSLATVLNTLGSGVKVENG